MVEDLKNVLNLNFINEKNFIGDEENVNKVVQNIVNLKILNNLNNEDNTVNVRIVWNVTEVFINIFSGNV